MSHQRLSTVFDYADLRLHPDGLRVHQSSTTNRRPVFAKGNVQTAREGWIARDAGGSGVVPKFRPRKKKTTLGSTDGDANENETEEEEGSGEEGKDAKRKTADRKGKGKAVDDVASDDDEDSSNETTSKRKRRKSVNKYKLKRLKFASDFDYLAPSLLPALSSTPKPTPLSGPSHNPDDYARASSSKDTGTARAYTERMALPEPSADMLKAIHRYAAEFYEERGQLLNISREYRIARKRRTALRKAKRLRKEAEKEKKRAAAAVAPRLRSRSRSQSQSQSRPASVSRSRSASVAVSVSSGESDEEMNESSGSSESDSDEDEDDAGALSLSASKSRSKGKQKATDLITTKPKEKDEHKRKRAKPLGDGKLYTDMYKVLDGSAMLALGMLVQEHIAHLLTPRVPPGWEDEMRAWYAQEDDDEGVQDEEIEGVEEVAGSAEGDQEMDTDQESDAGLEGNGAHDVDHSDGDNDDKGDEEMEPTEEEEKPVAPGGGKLDSDGESEVDVLDRADEEKMEDEGSEESDKPAAQGQKAGRKRGTYKRNRRRKWRRRGD